MRAVPRSEEHTPEHQPLRHHVRRPPISTLFPYTTLFRSVKLVCPADPGDSTVLRASPPQSAGRGTCAQFRIIGMCPAPVAGLADITALYAACFGPPPVGRRIFLRASTMVSGFESLPREFRALVPAP